LSSTRLDLVAIEASLRDVQAHFEEINASLTTPRDPMGDLVVENLLAGYEYLDELLADDIDLLARGNSRRLLQLNCLVLWGDCDPGAVGCAGEFHRTEERFYDDSRPGGLRALMNYLAEHRGDGIWRRAAGAYIQILSAPQLFVEGNHRTGALVMSHLLTRAGKPPFVLTVRNAKAYFDPSSLVKACRKRSFRAMLEVPKLRKRLAKFVEDEADPGFLRRQSAMARGAGKLKASG
jgi:hypothetical protein